jgi:protocatechuate 3,4-dioxygenase, alpha subunit
VTRFSQTPAQTIGPFFHDALLGRQRFEIPAEGGAATPIVVHGRMLDGLASPVTDAMIEVWQADAEGRYRHPLDARSSEVADGFRGFARVATDHEGRYTLQTIVPGSVPGRCGATQAPHLNLQVFARGLLDKLSTRVYFAGHDANGDDPVLGTVPSARRSTLLAATSGQKGGLVHYRFDVVLQGPLETVFFEV